VQSKSGVIHHIGITHGKLNGFLVEKGYQPFSDYEVESDMLEESVSDNLLSEESVSDNILSEDSISDNILSEDSVSDNLLIEESVSDNMLIDESVSDDMLIEDDESVANEFEETLAENI